MRRLVGAVSIDACLSAFLLGVGVSWDMSDGVTGGTGPLVIGDT